MPRMQGRDQLEKSTDHTGGPKSIGLLMRSTWHVPNDEVVVITVRYPKTMSEKTGPLEDVN
jgi:hypothetical protein